MLNSNQHETEQDKKNFLALKLTDLVFTMLLNVNVPLIVGILIFMSRITFMLS